VDKFLEQSVEKETITFFEVMWILMQETLRAPFHFIHTAGVLQRETQNVSEYMLVLALCLFIIIITDIYKAQYRLMTTI